MAVLLSYALTTVADVKELLGITSSTYDNLIVRKINQATRAIEAYCGRRFALTTYTDEGYNATRTDNIILRQRPVTTVTSLELRDTGLNIDDFDTVDTEQYFIDSNAGILNLKFGAWGSYGQYQVTYQAGYTTIPEDLAEACASLAAYYFNTRDAAFIGVSRKKEGQREVQYSDSTNLNFDSIIKNLGIDSILDSYSNYPIMTNR